MAKVQSLLSLQWQDMEIQQSVPHKGRWPVRHGPHMLQVGFSLLTRCLQRDVRKNTERRGEERTFFVGCAIHDWQFFTETSTLYWPKHHSLSYHYMPPFSSWKRHASHPGSVNVAALCLILNLQCLLFLWSWKCCESCYHLNIFSVWFKADLFLVLLFSDLNLRAKTVLTRSALSVWASHSDLRNNVVGIPLRLLVGILRQNGHKSEENKRVILYSKILKRFIGVEKPIKKGGTNWTFRFGSFIWVLTPHGINPCGHQTTTKMILKQLMVYSLLNFKRSAVHYAH